MPSYRVCPIHRSDLIEIGPGRAAGCEMMRCSAGHFCSRWLVINHKGEVTGSGKLSEYQPKEKDACHKTK